MVIVDRRRTAGKIRALGVLVTIAFAFGVAGCSSLAAESFPAIEPIQRPFVVPDVAKADVSLDIKSANGTAIYHLQCHSGSYGGDPYFVYSGDFECRLSLIGQPDSYSTLLTEDAHQRTDWESRGRFFGAELRDPCSRIPEFGASRSFKLRSMDLGLRITDPTFTKAGKLKSLTLTVTAKPDPMARRSIAEITPLPNGGKVPAICEAELRLYFVDYSALPGAVD